MKTFASLETMDLNAPFFVMAWAGSLMAVYLMQLTWHNDADDPMALRCLRRISLTILALAFAWIMSFALAKDWQPWPPMLVLIGGVDFSFGLRIATIHLQRRRRERRSLPVIAAGRKQAT